MSGSLETLFHEALALDFGARDGFVQRVEPALLREQLERLLAADAGAHSALVGLLNREISLVEPDWRGRQIGAWRLLEPLGAGGMGRVFLAEREAGGFKQRAALKLIRGFPSADVLARFERERQILARLNHPGIARLIDGGSTSDGQPFAVMELIDGVPIHEFARLLGVRDKVRLLIALSEAVNSAHQQLIVHRDIKPSNVLVDASGAPKLLDFGIAKLLDGDRAEGAATMAYSPGYASPEQLSGAPISTASDIYNLGLLLHQLLTGVNRDGNTRKPPALLSQSVTLPALKSELSGDLDAICARATHPEPTRRYASAQALADDLKRWLDGQPVWARADSSVYRLGKWIGRHRLASAVSLFALASLLVALVLLYRERDVARAAERAALSAAERATRAQAAAEGVASFMGEMFAQANTTRTAGKEVSARAVLDQAAAQLARDRVLDPSVRADLNGRLATAYMSLDQLDRARDLALEAAAATPAEQPILKARNRYLLAQIARRQGLFAEAEADNRAARLMLGEPPLDFKLAARMAQQMALLRNRTGDFSESLGFIASARGYLERGAVHDEETRLLILNTELIALDGLGLAEQALAGRRELYRAAVALEGELGFTALIHGINLLSVLLDRGLLDEAQALLSDLEPRAKQVYMPSRQTGWARLLRERAQLERKRGRPADALKTLDQAIAYDARESGTNNALSLKATRVQILLDLKQMPRAESEVNALLAALGAARPERAGRDVQRAEVLLLKARVQCASADRAAAAKTLDGAAGMVSELASTLPFRVQIERARAQPCIDDG